MLAPQRARGSEEPLVASNVADRTSHDGHFRALTVMEKVSHRGSWLSLGGL